MTNTAEPQASPPTLTWQLVHAEPGALVYALPGVKPATHPMVRRAAGRHSGGWLPSGTPGSRHQAGEHAALDYAEYIGRVGVLAAALGVGAAVVGTPGISWAEPTDADSSTSTSSSSTSAGTESESEPESSPTPETRSAPTSVVRSSGGAQPSTTDTSATAAAETSASSGSETSVSVSAPGSTSPPVVVRSSGGAQTSTSAQTPTSELSTAPAAGTPAQQQAVPSEGTTVEQRTTPTAAPPETATTPALPTEALAPAADSTTVPEAPAGPVIPAAEAPAETGPGPRHTAAPPAAPAAATAAPVSTLAVPERGVRPGPPPVRMPASVQRVPTITTADVSAVRPATATVATESTAASAPAPVTRVPVVNRIITAALSPFTAPTATPAVTAAQTPVLWGVFAWIRRNIFNQSPNISASTETTQVYDSSSGKLTATEADGPTVTQPEGVLAFDVAGGPAKGSITLDPAGTFTYISTAGHAAAVEPATLQDNFAVTVNDAHGGSTTVPVAVAIDPADTPPVMSLALSDPIAPAPPSTCRLPSPTPTPTPLPTWSSTTRPTAPPLPLSPQRS